MRILLKQSSVTFHSFPCKIRPPPTSFPESTTCQGRNVFSAPCRGSSIRFRLYPIATWAAGSGHKARETKTPIVVRIRALIVEIQRTKASIRGIVAVATAIRESLYQFQHLPLYVKS